MNRDDTGSQTAPETKATGAAAGTLAVPPPEGDRPAPSLTVAPTPPPEVPGTPVICPHCARGFRTPSDDPRVVIACPWCGTTHPRPALTAAPLPPPARQPRRLRALAAAGILSAGVLAGMWWAFQQFQPKVVLGGSAPAGPANPELAATLDQARAAAARALAAPDWASARPWLLDTGALAVEMAEYHAVHAWKPLTLTGPHTGSLKQGRNGRLAELSVPTVEGPAVSLRLYETPDGWKLDWKRLVRFRQFAWENFQEARPASPVSLEVLALRGSATNAHFAAAGLTPEDGLAVRLEGSSLGHPALAIVPKASDLGRLFQRELTWEHPLPYRCRLRHLAEGPVPPLVEITAYEGDGWAER